MRRWLYTRHPLGVMGSIPSVEKLVIEVCPCRIDHTVLWYVGVARRGGATTDTLVPEASVRVRGFPAMRC